MKRPLSAKQRQLLLKGFDSFCLRRQDRARERIRYIEQQTWRKHRKHNLWKFRNEPPVPQDERKDELVCREVRTAFGVKRVNDGLES
jgi:hypothetical protein